MKNKFINVRNILIMLVIMIFLIFLINTFVLSSEKSLKLSQVRQAKLDAIIANKQILDCSKCHSTGLSVIAKETINSSTCYNCHRDDIDFLVPITKNIHIYHEGNPSILPKGVDYSIRHKDILGECNSCHVFENNKTPDCTRCHTGNHINVENELNKKFCLDCHGIDKNNNKNINDLFRHDAIRLVTHNIFGNESCRMCHSTDKITLELANGNKIPIIKSSNLCKQCHSGTYNKWISGNHFAEIECIICHNPHSPKDINQTILEIAREITTEKKATPTPEKGEGIIKRPNYDFTKEE